MTNRGPIGQLLVPRYMNVFPANFSFGRWQQASLVPERPSDNNHIQFDNIAITDAQKLILMTLLVLRRSINFFLSNRWFHTADCVFFVFFSSVLCCAHVIMWLHDKSKRNQIQNICLRIYRTDIHKMGRIQIKDYLVTHDFNHAKWNISVVLFKR